MTARVDSAAPVPIVGPAPSAARGAPARRFGAVCCVAAVLAAAGCNGSAATAPGKGSKGEGAGTKKTTEDKAAENCRNLLENVLEMVQPDRYGISADADQVLMLLNEWDLNCRAGGEAPAPQSEGGVRLSPLLSATARERREGPHFRRRDVEHLRTCVLARRIATQVTAGSRDDLERVRRLYDHVVRNLPLIPADRAPLARLPVQSLIDGEGTATDRTRLFADLLRQVQLDAVVVRPAAKDGADSERAASEDGTKKDGSAPEGSTDPAAGTESAAAGGRWLVGVVVKNELYLFDPFLGLAVPSAAEWEANRLDVDPVEIVPATLSSLADGSFDLLARLDAGAAHPRGWHDADFARPRIEAIGDSSLWSERAARLQGMLSGQRAATIFDALDESPTRRSVATRVAQAGGGVFAVGDVGLWSAPEEIDESEALDEAGRQARAARDHVLDMPCALKDGQLKGDWPTLGRPERTLFKTRLVQLAGNRPDAIKGYLEVRLRGRIPPQWSVTPELRAAHREAEGDARFWTAVCLSESDQPENAVSTLIEYRKHFPQGRWIGPATLLLARSLHRLKDREGAVATLDEIPSGDPGRPAAQLLKSRWSAERTGTAAPPRPPAKP